MTQVWHHWHRVWIYVVLLIPFAVLAVVALRSLRPSRSWRRSVAEVGMVLGTLPWIWMIMTPMKLPPHATTVYLVPFSDLWDSLMTENAVPIGVQVGGNLLVLFALGFFAPIRFAALAGWITRLGLAREQKFLRERADADQHSAERLAALYRAIELSHW